MIKGCEKKMIVVDGGESSPFESAYFVLKRDSEVCGGGGDILREADRIIAESMPGGRVRARKREKIKRVLISSAAFLLGGFIGCGISLIAALIR